MDRSSPPPICGPNSIRSSFHCRHQRRSNRVRVLLTESRSKLGRSLAAALSSLHDVQTLDGAEGSGDSRNLELARAAVAGCGAIIHIVAPRPEHDSPLDYLDKA